MKIRSIAYVEKEKSGIGKKNKLRVAAYCRVSTLLESQQSSISAQRIHYIDYIASNPDWEPAGIYLEEGVSGTMAENRPELRRLMEDCRRGRVDLILTKSISRFARNTLDCISLVRELSALGVAVHFEKENIGTAFMEAELLLSLMACLAEEESHSISGNIKWSIRKRFAGGDYLPSKTPYGYRRCEESFVPEQAEAEVIRQIFDLTLSGCGSDTIARLLNQEGIFSPLGQEWNAGTIRMILRNPVYIGDMLYQKTYTDEAFRVHLNRGELDRFYHRGHHEAIISRETFEKVAAVMKHRSRRINTGEKSTGTRSGMSGKLFCAYCGSPMYRQTGGSYPTFRCDGRTRRKTDCRMRGEMEESIWNAFLTCLNKLAYSQRLPADYRILDVYMKRLREMVDSPDAEERCERADRLRQFMKSWKAREADASSAMEAFGTYIEKATVNTGISVIFRFACGMEFTESLRRPEQNGRNL